MQLKLSYDKNYSYIKGKLIVWLTISFKLVVQHKMKGFKIYIFLGVLSCISAFPLSEENNENIVLNEPSEIGGRILETWLKDGMIGNPEEQGLYFEGDLIMTEGRNGVTSAEQLWTKAIVPFQIAGSFSKKKENFPAFINFNFQLNPIRTL